MLRQLLSLLALATPLPAAATLRLDNFASGLTQPVFLTGRANNLFVLEQGGRIVQIDRSTRARTTFFTVDGIETGGEKGLLGFAFDRAYNRSGRFYVNVTTRINGQLFTEVRRYTNPAIASEPMQVVMRIPKSFDNHNGGWIGFGPDRMLYVATGDGGSGNDPQNNAQNRNVLLGKMLRIDVRSDAFPADPNRNYTIPASNPYGNEVFAYGLRNPYRSSFDAGTGDLWIGDVGQDRFEEVNVIRAGTSGQNFGWRPLEGPLPTPGVGDPIPPGTADPLSFYSHANGDRSITGGTVFRGTNAQEIAGRYIFGDFISGRIWSLGTDGQGLADLSALTSPFGRINISAFGEDANRALYLVGYDGRIFRFSGTRAPRVAAPLSNGFTAAPEPASWAMLILGFGLIGAVRRRQNMAPGRPA